VHGLGVISLLPRVRRLPDLLTHRTGTPSWSDGGVWFSCVFPTCAMVCSKRVQVRTRLCVSVLCRHVVMCVWEIKRINIRKTESVVRCWERVCEVRGGLVSVFIYDLCVRWFCDACVWILLAGIASYFVFGVVGPFLVCSWDSSWVFVGSSWVLVGSCSVLFSLCSHSVLVLFSFCSHSVLVQFLLCSCVVLVLFSCCTCAVLLLFLCCTCVCIN
jgi:hypothetical protein